MATKLEEQPVVEFSGQYLYGSYRVTPSLAQIDSPVPIPTDAIKWANGKFHKANSTNKGVLEFRPGIQLDVKFEIFVSDGQFAFTAQAIGLEGPTKGAKYLLAGWCEICDDQIKKISGSVIAVRGTESNSEQELGGQPLGTVGYFDLRQL